MAQGEGEAAGGGVAGDGGDGGHGEAEDVGDEGAELGVHEAEAGRVGPGPFEVEAVGEEFALRGGDEDGGGSGLGFDEGEVAAEGVEEGWVKAVVVVAGDG